MSLFLLNVRALRNKRYVLATQQEKFRLLYLIILSRCFFSLYAWAETERVQEALLNIHFDPLGYRRPE